MAVATPSKTGVASVTFLREGILMAGFGYRYRDDLPLIAITAFFVFWSLVLLYSPLGPYAAEESEAEGGLADPEAVVAYNPDNLVQVENEDAEIAVSETEEGEDPQAVEEEAPPAVEEESVGEDDLESDDSPLLAFIIDDWGYHWTAADGFLQLDAPMTYAVLPYQKYSREHAQKAKEAGYEVILHLPMAPVDPNVDPGPNAIRVTQDETEIRELVLEALAQVPEAVGVNNHMGSGVTEDSRTMRVVLETLLEQGKYFIDSHTSAKTVAPAVAKEIGIASAQNQVFLDNQADPEYVKERIRLAARVANEKGFAVAIGHVKEATLSALQEMIPALKQEGIRLVTVSELLAEMGAKAEAEIAAISGTSETVADTE